jgi:hypothetical protein
VGESDGGDFYLPLLHHPMIAHWVSDNWNAPPHPRLSQAPIGITDRRGDQSPGDRLELARQAQTKSLPQSTGGGDVMPPMGSKPARAYANFHHQSAYDWAKPAAGADGVAGSARQNAFQILHATHTSEGGQADDEPGSCVHFDHPTRPAENWRRHRFFGFVISPHGNGLDCHRTWEALILNSAPIVKTSPLDRLYTALGMPVVIVNDWSEVTCENMRIWQQKLAPAFDNEPDAAVQGSNASGNTTVSPTSWRQWLMGASWERALAVLQSRMMVQHKVQMARRRAWEVLRGQGSSVPGVANGFCHFHVGGRRSKAVVDAEEAVRAAALHAAVREDGAGAINFGNGNGGGESTAVEVGCAPATFGWKHWSSSLVGAAPSGHGSFTGLSDVELITTTDAEYYGCTPDAYPAEKAVGGAGAAPTPVPSVESEGGFYEDEDHADKADHSNSETADIATAPEVPSFSPLEKAVVGVKGKVVLLRRGGCSFGTKALQAEQAGAAGVLVIDNGEIEGGTGEGSDAALPEIGATEEEAAAVSVPMAMVSKATGDALLGLLAAAAADVGIADIEAAGWPLNLVPTTVRFSMVAPPTISSATTTEQPERNDGINGGMSEEMQIKVSHTHLLTGDDFASKKRYAHAVFHYEESMKMMGHSPLITPHAQIHRVWAMSDGCMWEHIEDSLRDLQHVLAASGGGGDGAVVAAGEAAGEATGKALEALSDALGGASPDDAPDICRKLMPTFGVSRAAVQRWCSALASQLSQIAGSGGTMAAPIRPAEQIRKTGLRVGYVSAYLGEHPIGYLLHGLFTAHRSHRTDSIGAAAGATTATADMDVHVFYLGNQSSELQSDSPNLYAIKKVVGGGKSQEKKPAHKPRAVLGGSRKKKKKQLGRGAAGAAGSDGTRFHHMARVTDGAVGGRVRMQGIDVLVDLDAYTRAALPTVMAQQSAPVQIHYLGQPMRHLAASFFHFFVTDSVMTPPDYLRKGPAVLGVAPGKSLEDKLLFFPQYYVSSTPQYGQMRSEATRGQLSDEARLRAALVANATNSTDGWIVLACFNQGKKISPTIFTAWMNLLLHLPRALLWLTAISNNFARQSLRAEAAARGVRPGRVIFAPFVKGRSEHLSRMR